LTISTKLVSNREIRYCF